MHIIKPYESQRPASLPSSFLVSSVSSILIMDSEGKEERNTAPAVTYGRCALDTNQRLQNMFLMYIYYVYRHDKNALL